MDIGKVYRCEDTYLGKHNSIKSQVVTQRGLD